MKKQIFLLLLLAAASNVNEVAMGQCASPATYDSPTGYYVPVFKSGTATCIKNSQIYDNGTNVGIGTTGVTSKLTVANGDIDVNTAARAYRIGNQNFLWNHGITSNIYAGVNSGNYTSVTSNHDNTFVGYSTGNSINQGQGNIILGSMGSTTSGSALTDGNWNVFIGYEAGLNTVDGIDNTFVGHDAGLNNIGSGGGTTDSGNHNSFFGDESGKMNTYGYYNMAAGAYSLHENTTGYFNSCLGYNAGYNTKTGLNNTFVGAFADCGATNLTNASAIGAGAKVMVTNSMILGDNAVNVGIGLSTNTTGPLAKFHVFRDLFKTASNPTAVYVENIDQDSRINYSTGIKNITHGNNEFNYGVISDVYNANDNIAGEFFATHAANEQNIGGYFWAEQAPVNFGVIGYAPVWVEGTHFNVGVYGEAPVNSFDTSEPLPTTLGAGTYAGYFNGDLVYTGKFGHISDSTIKTNIQLFKNAGSILHQINCYSYYYDSTKYGNHINLPKTKQYGVLAQEVEKADSVLVINGNLPPKIDSTGNVVIPAQKIKMVDYVAIVPLLLEGYHEQQAIIDSLNIRLTDLETLVATCCAANRGSNNSNPERTGQNEILNVKLQNIENSILYTNEPNPYTSSTTIRFFIPENVHDVKITFQDATGKTLKEVPINETGQGSIKVDGSDLISGTYTYSLVIGGKVVDTKKMVKVK